MKPARNDPCSCGSGKKFRHCCEGKVTSHSPAPSSDQLNQLVSLYNSRRYAELESRARSLVGKHPDSGYAWKLLGASLKMQGKDALSTCQKVIQLMPNDAEAHFNLGAAMKNLGRLEDAVASYRRALELKPDSAETLYNLGATLMNLGQLNEAVACYYRALELRPDAASVHFNLGNTLKILGQFDEAVGSYQNAIKLNPNYAEAHNNLGIVLKILGKLDKAAESYQRAINIKPEYVEAHSNLGLTLQQLGQLEGALASCQSAALLNPNLAEAQYNLGFALQNLGQLENALACCRRAVKLKPNLAEAHNSLGIILKDLNQFEASLASYHDALEINPDYAEAYNNLGNTLTEIGQLDDAASSYRRALEIKPDFTDASNNLLFSLNYKGSLAPLDYLALARQYGRLVAAKVGTVFSAWQCTAQPERLRVGLVSGDLRIHSVGQFLEGLLSHLDPARVELIAYSTHHIEDELTARIRPFFSAWKSLVGKSDEDAARLIHADGVHVLLDISGHTAHNRLPVFAWRPAPVQVTWLGLPTTTGVSEMDYVLGDLQAIPPEHENHFSETVWRLPDSYLCFSAPAYPVNVALLPALAKGYVTFGSFNNLTKMNDAVVELWGRILLSVPSSRLYLKTGQLNDESIREQTRQRFAAAGIAPERLLLGGKLGSIADHLSEYSKIDVALDTFPYPGVTTSVEALWMGVPVLTLHGDRFLSLTAKSVAHHAGLPDWVADDKDDYVAKAVAYTSNLERLAALRAGLRQQVIVSPLFDAPRFARNFENALWDMWQASAEKPTAS